MIKLFFRYIFLSLLCFSLYSHGSEKLFIREMHVEVEDGKQENFAELYSQYVGKNVSLDSIDDEVIEYFTKQDYLFPQVTISQEDLKKGFLNIKVKMTNIDNVIIYTDEKDNPLIDEYIKQILAERPARIKNFQKYIALMNRIPGYQVQYEFRPAESDDAVDLALTLSRSKADIYTSSDSYGDSDLGQMQNVVSAQVFSPFGGNDSWTTYGLTTNHPDRLYSVGTMYSRIINNYGTAWNLGIVHSSDNSSFDDPITTKDGIDNSYNTSFNHPLYLDENQTFEGEIGATYKTSKAYTADINISRPTRRGQKLRDLINPHSRIDTESRNWVGNIMFNYLSADSAGGSNYINLTFAQGLGGDFKNYTDPQDIPDDRFKTTTLNISRDQALPNDFSIFSCVMAGYSGDDLPDQEVFSLGGRDFGRGYESGILSGNRTFASSIELRYNKEMDDDPLFQLIQPYVFRDMGYIGKQASDTNISHLDSYGAGVRFVLTHNANVELEIAQPMKKSYIIDGIAYEAKTVLGIMGSKSFRF